ncbi:MAG: fasciclin domain-containing protein, partial [Flavobacteriales bacterium]|nr:fasciclin domain-containing protein [Flavobacteriales bacterium]
GTPEGVCMGIIEFDTPGIYNFDSSYGFDAQAGMTLTINSDAFVLEDLFAEVDALDSVSIWQSQFAFQAYTSSYLNGDAPYTIFVPNDDAVADILEILSIGQFGIFDLPNFGEILEYHIAEGLYFEEDLYDGLMLTSAQGQELTITENESGFLVDNAQIVNSNYTAYNGVIHVIDQCLAPSSSPESTVMQIIADSPDHEILEEAILALGLDDELSSLVILDNDGVGLDYGPGPWTVFAPTDEAFELFIEEMGWTVYDLIESQSLSNIINQHIVNGCVDDFNFPYEIDEYCYEGINNPLLSTDLEFNIATNLDGESLQFIVNENSISVVGQQNTVEIIVTDLVAYNGVVHVIDAVITPKFEEIQAGSCDLWTLELTSSIEEGWSGDALGVVINNTLEETITVSEGSQEFIYQFGVDNNDIIDLIYFADGGSSYNSYKLIDGEGQVIVQWTGNFNNSPTGYSGIYACEAYDPDICEKITIELMNEFGYGWPYSSLDVYRNGNYDQSVEMPIGYSQITQINAYENDSFDFIVNTQLMFPEELGGYKIRSESGTTLVDEDIVNEAPESSYNIIVCESDVNVNLDEIDSNSPNLVKMIDVFGRVQKEHKQGELLFYLYKNGEVKKIVKP